MNARLCDLGERDVVRRINAGLATASAEVVLGPGDDAAILEADPGRVVLTVDRQREGVHFQREWLAPEQLGRRALAVAASDVGAMGARPRAALLALELPPTTEVGWLDRMVTGLASAGAEMGCPIVGGDVVASAALLDLCVTVVGTLPAGVTAVTRAGARAGHDCWLVGHAGRAAAGRGILEVGGSEVSESGVLCLDAYRSPRPALAFAADAARIGLARAMMDVSDGLAIDLSRLCEASGVGVGIEACALEDAVLTSAAVALRRPALELALWGGDDYALLVAVAPADRDRMLELADTHRVPAVRLGAFAGTPAESRIRVDGQERTLGSGGWDHFAERSP